NVSRFQPPLRCLVGLSLKKVDAAIVQAYYLKDQFVPYVHADRVYVLYQAMDFNEFPLSREERVVPRMVLFVGHLTKAKGYTDVVKVIPRVARVFPDVLFCFAGAMRSGERGVFFNQATGERILYEDPFIAEKTILNSP